MDLRNTMIHVSFPLKHSRFLFFIFLALSLSCAGFPQTPAGDSQWERVLESPEPAAGTPAPTPQGTRVEDTEAAVRIELSGDILFDFDRWDIRPGAGIALEDVAEVIKRYPDSSVLIEGYTDSKGSASYNLRLSARRAEAVKNWLVENGGIDGKDVITRGRGEEKPIAPNAKPDGSDDPAGRQKNRRVEITVKK